MDMSGDNPVVIIKSDDNSTGVIVQPHHPNAYMLAPWASEEEARTWAEVEVQQLNTIMENNI